MRRDGLKIRLNDLIRREQYISYQDLVLKCQEWRYKLATAERRLRRSESSNVETVIDHGAITGYKWHGVKLPPLTISKPIKQDQLFRPGMVIN